MDLSLIRCAELHYIQEQTARLRRIREGWDPTSEFPHLEVQWASITPKLREEYIERARFLAAAHIPAKAQNHYEDCLKYLYSSFFAEKPQGYAEMTVHIHLTNFIDHVNLLSTKSFSKLYGAMETQCDNVGADRSPIEDSGDEDDTMVDVSQDYEPRYKEDPEILNLETTVQRGVGILTQLRQVFHEATFQIGDIDWKEEIDQTFSYSEAAKVVIGVVGSTGAGKSSLINAIVDEENILATNCMRASTAVATEISYNHGHSNYKAEIEFITRSEWENELQILFKDLSDNEEDVLGGHLQKDSEAAVALDKIKAVYPFLDREQLLEASIDKLLNHTSVLEMFGTTLTIEEKRPKVFSRALRSYIDSKERKTAQALSTGAVLVDLPGVSDSNAARVAVAQRYMKRCSAHWIVAPINRAVDDKIARDLLGHNFKFQMQMDMALGGITFICSKTDDISVTEVQDSLQLTLPSVQFQTQMKKEQADLIVELQKLQQKKKVISQEMDYMDEEIYDLESKLPSEDLTMAISDLSPKRKRPAEMCSSQDALDMSTSQMQMASDLAPDTASEDIADPEASNRIFKYRSFKIKRKELNGQKRLLNMGIAKHQEKLEHIQHTIESNGLEILHECIEARNNYSKGEIRQDFAYGIRDIDQEIFDGESEERNPTATSQPMRNYEKLKNDLPVFCISTRAYQKLRGRLRKETKVAGYSDIEDTEIPLLQRHCLALTERARETSARRFLVKLRQVLQSLSIWSTVTNPTGLVSEDKRNELKTSFDLIVKCMRKDMENSVKELFGALREVFKLNIYNNLDRVSKHGTKEFPLTVSRWNAAGQDGAIRFSTYRAICRRQGVFRRKDMNQELAHPLLSKIANGWMATFASLPTHTEQLIESLGECLKRFHKNALRFADKSIRDRNSKLLREMLNMQYQTLQEHLQEVEMTIKNEQKDVNRIFSQSISKELSQVYQACAEERGLGSLKRMRAIMQDAAEQKDNTIISNSVQSVEGGLINLLVEAEKAVATLMSSMVERMSRDYYTVIIEAQIRRLSEEQIELKKRVAAAIGTLDAEFHPDAIMELQGPIASTAGADDIHAVVKIEEAR
ncbi:hypothetical protein FE257_010667 [Aspergillus nanangensis]|uniref:Uncharacterized protein n=1 Tax=Aspergillus nanangensis TaxID=2582783 RepID=A0AAD4CI31_ASPNN|nr:hypothetical protein FE257_010667 [Aspergillus nanangensis]